MCHLTFNLCPHYLAKETLLLLSMQCYYVCFADVCDLSTVFQKISLINEVTQAWLQCSMSTVIPDNTLKETMPLVNAYIEAILLSKFAAVLFESFARWRHYARRFSILHFWNGFELRAVQTKERLQWLNKRKMPDKQSIWTGCFAVEADVEWLWKISTWYFVGYLVQKLGIVCL